MKKELVCIVCPNGCELSIDIDENGKINSVTGNICKRGEEYARQEMVNPMRTIASSVLIEGGELPLASVRLTKAIPKDMIATVMEEIKKIKLPAPVSIGQVVVKGICNTDSDLIITKNVACM